jgi:hypothetical protein
MIYGSRSDGPAYVDVVTMLRMAQCSPEVTPVSDNTPGYGGDLSYFPGNDYNPFIVLGPLRLSDVLGCGQLPHESENQDWYNRIHKPYNSPWDGDVDRAKYGSLFNMLNGLNQSVAYASRPQHDVTHFRLNGSVSDVSSSPRYAVGSSFFNDPVTGEVDIFDPLFTPHAVGWYRATGFNSTGFLTFEQQASTPSYFNTLLPHFDLYSYAKQREQYFRLNGELSWNLGRFNYRSHSHTSSIWRTPVVVHVEADYKLDVTVSGSYFGDYTVTALYDVHLWYELRLVPVFGSASFFDWNWISPDAIVLDNRTVVKCIDAYEHRADLGDRREGVIVTPIAVGHPITIKSNGIDPRLSHMAFCDIDQRDDGLLGSNLAGMMKQGKSSVNQFAQSFLYSTIQGPPLQNIRPSGFYAACDALNKASSLLKGSNLQTLVKLPGFVSSLPDFGKVAKFLAAAAAGDIAAIPMAVDYISEQYLKYQFENRPSLDIVKQVLSKDLTSEIAEITARRWETLYGKFDYSFRNEDSWMSRFGDLSLETRSELRVYFDFSTLAASLFAADNAGFLPTMSRIWSLVPFSFVVDWFANIGGRIRSVEQQLEFAALAVNYINYSYKITLTFSEDYLLSQGLVCPDSEQPFTSTLYIREFSRCTPSLRDSKFDFEASRAQLNAATIGALMWQLAK